MVSLTSAAFRIEGPGEGGFSSLPLAAAKTDKIQIISKLYILYNNLDL